MKRIFATLCLLACLPDASVSAGDYGCLWWALGNPYYKTGHPSDAIPADYPGKKQVLCFHTGTYGMAIDTINLNRVHLGIFDKPVPYETAINEISKLFEGLAEHTLSIEVRVGGRTYTCVGRDQPAQSKLFPVKFIEYGRYFQHVQITHLIMQDSRGRNLDADCWLEISSWPDSLNMTCHVDNKAGRPDEIILDVGLRRSGQIVHKEGESLVVLPLVKSEDPASAKDVTVALPANTRIGVACSESIGGHVISIRSTVGSREGGTSYPEHLDALDKWPFTLRNSSTRAKTFRLLFDTDPRSITGFTSMVLDEQGIPTGIPVQISKNWHKDKQPLRYDGPWAHGSTVITVPPMTTRNYQYAVAYARWGGVPAASHAQLSLVGWGHNMMWDEAAVGSFGESICYEPGRTQRRSFITDVRPLMVLGMNGKKWTWTANAGGGDFLVCFDGAGKYLPMIKTRGRYYACGPNLTKVVYDEMSQDGSIAASYTVKLARVDDYLRVFHHIRYDVLKSMEFTRLAFYQMPSDYYNNIGCKKIAIGNTRGMGEEWTVRGGPRTYDKQSIPLPGRHPWVSLHDVVNKESVTQVARGFIIRKWDAVLGAKPCALPHLSTYVTERGRESFRMAAELAPPSGLTQLKPGDFIDVEIEQVVLPSKAGLYYGPNEYFKNALAEGANTWKPVYRETVGNDLAVAMDEGALRNNYPVEIAVSEMQNAVFTITGGVGYVPITFTQLKDYRGYILCRRVDGKSVPVEQGASGTSFWQTDYDEAGKTWSITYNVDLDASQGTPAEFMFGP